MDHLSPVLLTGLSFDGKSFPHGYFGLFKSLFFFPLDFGYDVEKSRD